MACSYWKYILVTVLARCADLEQQVELASTPTQERNALLDRAPFYLLWYGGLRLGELEELC